MLKIKEAVVVEGKYDKIRLSSVLDAFIITTDGFGIFKNTEALNLIRRAAAADGIVILTDSDSAGFKIRSYIRGAVAQGRIINAYIPDIYGKEKRKAAPSAEGKLGVEGIPVEILKESLEAAGVTVFDSDGKKPYITYARLFEDGLSGGASSKQKRKKLCSMLSLPERLNASSLAEVLNRTVTEEEYKALLKRINDGE